ncbi:transglutaminaseTgpA domain-containing protein [Psychromonas hadalis]|uniref:transglutaminase family protein n=1 Tax=Psychromonas hadalis TaxID=211669 RepID=UPI0003B6AAD7|nr:DUF3488 and transglutaminase-like domain-containing protein [Psychromonas hadalis]
MMKEFLNRFNLTLIIVSYSALVMVFYAQLNVIVMLFGLCCALWRSAHFFGKLPLMPRLLISVIAVLSSIFTVILLYQQGLFAVMLHLIFLGFSLKFLELKSVRDVYFFVNTGFILIALFFIFNTALSASLIASLLVLLLVAVLLSLHAQQLTHKLFNKTLLKSMVLSLPLALLLFVVMPRLPSLWKMPLQKQATTGLSDTVSPGEIAKLSRSSALAFRATFKGYPVPENQRYWRAMTLDNFDGKTWSQSVQKKAQERKAKSGSGHLFSAVKGVSRQYELIIEPHYNYWIPVLDFAVTPKGLVSLSDYSLRSVKPIVARQVFVVSQINNLKNKLLTSAELKQLTQLPDVGNVKTDLWITENLHNGLSKENILRQLLTGFSQSFTYTLQPPLLGENQIDDFLFSTQAGFCVHYASSYLYVARRLGFPARMVTGYLGGEWQATEGFFTVRQYDAHAWVEIWKDNRWLRVDPTAYVAPERVESGLQAGLTDGSEFLADEFFSLQKWRSIAVINQLRSRLAQLDYLWARYVVNFDNKKQMQLMQYWIAKMPWLNIAYALMLMMALIFALLLLVIFKPWQVKKIAIEDKIYQQLQKHFKKQGINRTTGQTVSEYCLMLHAQLMLSKMLCESFAAKYNAIKYQGDISEKNHKKQLKQLRFIAKQLKKPRS